MVEHISNLFSFFGGIGLFFYGMNVMGENLQRVAGQKLSNILKALTSNKFIALLLGTFVTAVIQSSAATIIMVVGFVNAGIMQLAQAVPVIMGANIGTTITAWIVSLSQLGSIFKFLNPSFWAPLLIGICGTIVVISNNETHKTKAKIFVGLSLIFIGLELMQTGVKPYSHSQILLDCFTKFGNNPFLGVIVGCIVTILVPSSSVSISILQMLALTGLVNREAAIYITLGQNLGSVSTVLLSTAGANTNGKRAAMIHLVYNIFKFLPFFIISLFLRNIFKDFLILTTSPVEISLFHTVFNICNAVVQYPFTNLIVNISSKLVKGDIESDDDDVATKVIHHLDDRLFESPAVAIEATHHEITRMTRLVKGNLYDALDSVYGNGGTKLIEKIKEKEQKINKINRALINYLVKINALHISVEQRNTVTTYLNILTDLERIGDHAENISESAQSLYDAGIKLSDESKNSLNNIIDIVKKSLDELYIVIDTFDLDAAKKVKEYEHEVDNYEDKLKSLELKRLAYGVSKTEEGVVFLECINNLERVSDHADNIANYIIYGK